MPCSHENAILINPTDFGFQKWCPNCGAIGTYVNNDLTWTEVKKKQVNDIFAKLVEVLLKDEDGISGEAYNLLYDLSEALGETESLKTLGNADATDGRFYTKE